MNEIMNKKDLNARLDAPIPEIGKEYHFFDDGKTSPSRHYICRCERRVKPKEAKKITFDLYDGETTLYERWKDESLQHDFLFSEYTEYLETTY